MKFNLKNLFILGILTTFGIMLWLLLTPSLSSEIVFLSYSKNRLLMNVVAIVVLLFLLISFWSLRFQNSQLFFKKVFSSKLISFLFIFVILIILLSSFFYLRGNFAEKSIYYEKLIPLLLLFFLLSVDVLIYQSISTDGFVFRFIFTTFTNIVNKKTNFVIGFILCIYLVTVFFSLSKGHNWGDDFTHYLLQSNSMLTGTINSYVEGIDFTNINSTSRNSPTTVPWGFPIFLLPFVKIFNQNILGLKLVNVFAYTAFLIILYKWSSIRLSKLASVLVLLFFAISPTFIQFHNQVITDLFFLMCSMMSLLLIDLYISRPGKKIFLGILLGFSIFYASFTRTSGYLLLAALGFAQVIPILQKILNKKKIEFAQIYVQIIPYLVFALCYLIQKLLLPNSYTTVQYVINAVSTDTVQSNLAYYFWLLSGIFSDLFFSKVIYLITLPLFILGIIVNRKSLSSWTVIVYALLTLVMYILAPNKQGIRYIFPIIPIYIVYIVLGCMKIITLLREKCAGIVTTFLALICLGIYIQYGVADVKYAIRNINAERIELISPYSPKSVEMFDFIRANTNLDDVIVFVKPRSMRYFTGRDTIFSNTCEGLSQSDYLVWMKVDELRGNRRQMKLTELDKCIESQKLDMMFENDESAIYEIMKD